MHLFIHYDNKVGTVCIVYNNIICECVSAHVHMVVYIYT